MSLPLQQQQAAQLLAAGEAAPFGKGSATLLHPDVRQAIALPCLVATQIDASKLQLDAKWKAALKSMTDAKAADWHA